MTWNPCYNLSHTLWYFVSDRSCSMVLFVLVFTSLSLPSPYFGCRLLKLWCSSSFMWDPLANFGAAHIGILYKDEVAKGSAKTLFHRSADNRDPVLKSPEIGNPVPVLPGEDFVEICFLPSPDPLEPSMRDPLELASQGLKTNTVSIVCILCILFAYYSMSYYVHL